MILITGCAGFIGWKVTEYLLKEGFNIVGIDNMNSYYDVRLKEWRLNQLLKHKNFKFYKLDITDFEALKDVFKKYKFDLVINLAARAGVRYSLENPWIYIDTNIKGTLNLLELCKTFKIKKHILASTSSIYANVSPPFKEDANVDRMISVYAASKKAAESLCYVYHYHYDIDITILRYFTVYGPAGRPDMSIFRFIYFIKKGVPITIFGDGTQRRDFTYIDDIALGTLKAIDADLKYEIINLGNDNPVTLNYVISLIEKNLNKKAKKIYKQFHKADLKITHANIEKAKKLLNWEPRIRIEEGIRRTVNWFNENWYWIKDLNVK